MRRLLVVVAITAAPACASSPPPAADDTSTSLAEAAVGIVVDGCTLVDELGSGAVVEEPGQVITVAHTLSGARSVTVVDTEGTGHDATISAFDPDSDLAVLDVPGLDVAPLPLATGPAPLGDATVYGWSRADGVSAIPVEVSRRLAITIEDIYVEDQVERTGIELVGDIDVGVSGGPVIDADGEVIGIVYARSRGREGIGFATDSDEVRELLDVRPLGPVDRCRP